MSSVAKIDFEQLLNFLEGYSLSESTKDVRYGRLIRIAHKKYLAALTFSAEFERQGLAEKHSSKRKAAMREYFRESVSDLGSGLFCLCNGAYKPGRMMLRSALETLAKGLAVSKHLKILREKNVFNVLKSAKQLDLFKETLPSLYFSQLESYYALLCEDVHTAGRQNMALIGSLASFPDFDAKKAQALGNVFSKVSVVCVSLQVMMLRSYYHHMHFSNRPIVRDGIHKDVLRYLSGAC